MGYISLQHAINDLKKHDDLIIIDKQVDPYLEMAEIHRRIHRAGGPAILYTNVKGSPFKAVSNLYGTYKRTQFLFRNEIENLMKIVDLKIDPTKLLKKTLPYLKSGLAARHALAKKTNKSAFGKTSISQLPQIVSWPDDGGAFITLPQVFTLPPGETSPMKANIGMYRIQLSGNQYLKDKEVGLHYQLHRGIGVHQKMYETSEKDFRVSIFVGGPPSHTFTSIMPLPEGLSEVTFAGMLNGKSWRYRTDKDGYVISTAADFAITGKVVKDDLKPEGPFGDHLGYYSLKHDFPYMKVDSVYHKPNAIWHFTVVGRPPAEDSNFGKLISDIVAPLTASEFPGLHSINAVDAAGVHPLLLAVGAERYMPFRQKQPEEVLTIAHHLLGKGQTSLAKYLFIINHYDNPDINADNIEDFFTHFLERIDLKRDLHFMTNTTIDTLDYSGSSWNAGSKLIAAAVGEKRRNLGKEVPSSLSLPSVVNKIQVALPGILAISGDNYVDKMSTGQTISSLTQNIPTKLEKSFPLIVFTDDADFTSASLNNFLWEVFTRSNPAEDLYAVEESVVNKHWVCGGSLIIDARTKPHHAPTLETDPKTSAKVDQYFRRGGILEKYG